MEALGLEPIEDVVQCLLCGANIALWHLRNGKARTEVLWTKEDDITSYHLVVRCGACCSRTASVSHVGVA